MANLIKQRILIIQEKIPPYRVDVFNALARACEQPLTVMYSGTLKAGATDFEGVRVQEKRWGPFRYQALENLSDAGFDIIIAMFDVRWLSTLRLVYGKKKSRLILWGHGFGRNQMINKWRLKFARKADALLLYDDAGRHNFEENGLPAHKIFVAPNTLHVPKYKIDWDADRTDFLFVGRLQERKRLDEFLLAFSKIYKKLPQQYRLVIVGDGKERTRLELLADELQLGERISFLGEIREADKLAEVFNQSLVYVSPGTVGLGVLHSFAHGVPIIAGKKAHHSPEVNNIVDGDNGYFYDDTIESLAELLLKLAEDKPLSIKLGKQAHACYWNTHTIDHMVDGFRQAIQYVSNVR